MPDLRGCLSCRQWKSQPRLAPATIPPIFERQTAPMGLSDLPAQDKPNSGTPGFGGEEWNKKIGGICQPRPFILDAHLNLIPPPGPLHRHPAPGFKRGVHGVTHQVDEKLFQLVGVRAYR